MDPPNPLLLPAAAALPWLGAAVVAALPGRARRTAAGVAGAVALAVLAALLAHAPALAAGDVARWSVPWLPALGLDLGLRLDGLAALFVGLVAGIGALVVLYAAWYLEARDPAPRFFALLLLFMGAMLGVVLADNLVLLVVFWEATSLSSFLLIGYWHRRADVGAAARDGALQALAVTGAGGLALLGGVLLLGHIAGGYSLDVVLGAGERIRAHPLYETALVLVLLGAFTKSAQFPFHFWLPHAMAAPTPVSAYLHSATMVKAGVFLLARLYPALGGSETWFWIVSCAGLATLLVGAALALLQHDLKGLLAYSTVSHLGLVTLLFGLDEPLAVVAAVFHVVNHAIFKAGLFMAAGIIDHECGTRDLRRINGLARLMPFTAALGITAAAAMAGVPLLNGFLSKEMFFAETLSKQTHAAMMVLLPAGALLAGVLSVAYSARFVHDTFFNGQPVDLPRTPHEPPFVMRLPVLLLVLACLAVGLAPQAVVGPVLAVAAQSVLGAGTPLPAYTLAPWHGFNAPLAMSAVAVVLGAGLYFGLQRGWNLHRVPRLRGLRDVFAAAQSALLASARGTTRLLENGSLQRYLALLLALAVTAGAWPFLTAPATDTAPAAAASVGAAAAAPFTGTAAPLLALLLAALGVAATVACTLAHRRRMTALVLAGAVGLVVCVAFAALSAPDLALTQLLVEVATVMLVVLAMAHLPDASPPERGRWRQRRDLVLALAVGGGLAALTWAVTTRPSDSISPYYLQQTLPLGGGANAVNVIIVDFRGFDTLGEITVMGIAALIVHALLAGFTPPRSAALGAPAGWPAPALMLRVVGPLVLPFAVVIALYLYLRGHNLPGGGFVAGLVLAVGLLLHRMAQPGGDGAAGTAPRALAAVGWGLVLAVATGAASALFGAPFLTSTWAYPVLPVLGAVPLASAAAFDLGVWIVVAGATLAMLVTLTQLTRRTAAAAGGTGGRP